LPDIFGRTTNNSLARTIQDQNEESVEQPKQLANSVGEFTVVVAPSIDPGKSAQSELVNAEQLAAYARLSMTLDALTAP
jgi:hypothetical protein